jgi:lysophospholipase
MLDDLLLTLLLIPQHAYNVSQIPAWTLPASPIYQLVAGVNSTFYAYQPDQQLDIAALPSPFQGIRPGTYEDSNETQLRLIDGGLDGQVDPIFPLIVAARDIDVIVIADAVSVSRLRFLPDSSVERRAELSRCGPCKTS